MPRAIRFYHFVFSWQFTPLKGMQVHHWAVRTGNSGPGIDGGLLRGSRGWLAYCKDTEDILFGRLEASTGMK